MEIYELKANNRSMPLGIELEGLTLSWKIKCESSFQAASRHSLEGKAQGRDRGFEPGLNHDAQGDKNVKGRLLKSIHIVMAENKELSNPCYDSGEILWDTCLYTPDVRLEPGRRYYWRVAVTDDAGNCAESEITFFEGGHPAESWSGRWITAPFVPELHPVFRKDFRVSAQELADLTARLYICGLGLYEVYLNGEKVGDEYLTPYFSDYRYWIQYQTYDVRRYLKAGVNRMDVYLGNGWYKGKFGYLNKGELRNYYGTEFKLLADLYLTPGGTESDSAAERENTGKRGVPRVIGTDGSWLALKSPVIVSGIYDGEIYDSRLEAELAEVPERKRLYAVETEEPKGKLAAMLGVPVGKRQILKVQSILTTPLGETVLDFGQEITGWAAFTGAGAPGQRITLQYGEVLQDGCFYRENLRTARAEFCYIANGKTQFIRPHFTFYGFRYVKVTGMEVSDANAGNFEAWALYSELEETGCLKTSHEKVNRLIENTKWSQRDNFLDIPTDCPQRDERLGWTGDAQIFSAAASYHMMTAPFFRKYLKDMRLEQREKGGAVPYVVPDVLTLAREMNGEPEFDMTKDEWGEAGASVWGDAAVIIPWNQYLFYGNKSLLAEQYDNMKQWMDFVIHMDETHCGGRRLWDCGFHFGDWLSLDAEDADDRRGGTDKYMVSSAYYMHAAGITAKAAGILGKEEDAAYYGQIAREVRAAVRERYMAEPGVLRINTQTAYVLGIYFHIFEEEEMAEAARRLKELLEENGDHLSTGFVGTAYLCQALCMAGLTDKAYTLLLGEDYPGWLYEVNLGATTIWERWNSLLPDGKVSGTGMNSLNHYAYGAIVEWIYAFVCGLRPLEEGPGFRLAEFAPRTDPRLDYAQAEYHSVNGAYKAGWRRDGGRICYTLEVPFGCEAILRLPCGAEAPEVWINGSRTAGHHGMRLSCGKYEIAAGAAAEITVE